jgi:hypothetical protein
MLANPLSDHNSSPSDGLISISSDHGALSLANIASDVLNTRNNVSSESYLLGYSGFGGGFVNSFSSY